MKVAKRPLEFKALELRVSEESQSPHTIYFKEHSVREQREEKPSGRTLFVVNIPPYADEKGITNAFSEAGKVVSVAFSLKPSVSDIKPAKTPFKEPEKPAFRIAYLVFSKVAELHKALKLTSLRPMNFGGHQIKCGLKKYIEEYNNSIFHPKALEEVVDVYMREYDVEKRIDEKREKKAGEEDDDGWVTVTKKGKVQSFARSEKVENKIMEKEEKGKKRKELKNFYTFQIRESKMKHIVSLRQKFEEDKKKILQIKQSRRFKPF